MTGTPIDIVLLVAAVAAMAAAGIRWLRVAQREHYLAGSVSRFAGRWWWLGTNRWLAAAALVGLAAAAVDVVPAGLLCCGVLLVGPLGLGLRGRTSRLAWTRRLKTLALTSAALAAVVVALGALGGLRLVAVLATVVALAVPLVVDAALVLTGPLEERLSAGFVGRATAKLRSVRPVVVAITGSYGKTSTKAYVAHLVAGSKTVVATPASFNNRMGLSRAINEGLTPGTEVFVAEMGTYGPGEIADLCSWITPTISVITAIGPVHLERMGSEERIAAAKAEILPPASVAVLNVDSPWLAPLADQVAAQGKKVWRCSGHDRAADVCVVREGPDMVVWLATGNGEQQQLARIEGVDAAATNVACAVAVALELGVTAAALEARLGSLPNSPNRQTVRRGATGATIIDDTYNANPAGAASALELAERLHQPGASLVVVTPGMVELGTRQFTENERFAQSAAEVATHLLVVGRTNLAPLESGARGRAIEIIPLRTRDQAVEWVTGNLGAGDVVLYENDLPDHFP